VLQLSTFIKVCESSSSDARAIRKWLDEEHAPSKFLAGLLALITHWASLDCARVVVDLASSVIANRTNRRHIFDAAAAQTVIF
jgi:hypothetical protein